jgi:Fe-S oxidoreductase
VLDFEKADPEVDTFGAGRVEDFTWKAWLDFTTCTECGRCQSQCPAWNTAKPLSPKLLILSLRDHAYAKAPYLAAGGHVDMTGGEQASPEQLAHLDPLALLEGQRPLVGGPSGDPAELGGVIDPEVLWDCTSCGACVEQCPVDIEHVDHIVDMRRYQVMIESEFPSELGGLFRNLENKGNPWGQNQSARMDWAKDLDFQVPVVSAGDELDADYEYLFWVGCAGAFEDRARKTTRAVAELLYMAAVGFAVLGTGETCTGDPARRAGNEFLFQMLAQQNVEVINAAIGGRAPAQRKIVVTCAHCFNTLRNEYPQLGGEWQVVHHTQLLNRLVREKRLVPVRKPDRPAQVAGAAAAAGVGEPAAVGAGAGAAQDSVPQTAAELVVAAAPAGSVTYHDPCYLGRHNQVYTPPRELIAASGVTLAEMPRNSARSFCCGAGGARMWMEERVGKRINLERTDEALTTGAKTIITGCPFCRVMLTDGVTARQNAPETADVAADVQVDDVANLLLAAVKPGGSRPHW